MVNDSVLERIRKLLALARGSTNDNEAANAFAQAQTLLSRHKLDAAQVELTTGVPQVSEPILNSSVPLYSGKRVIHWKSSLANEIARLNACKLYINNSIKGIEYRLIGRQSDIDIVSYLFDSIVSQIEAASALALYQGKGHGKTFTNNFKHAASAEVIRRLIEAKNSVQTEFAKTNGTAAMVLVDSRMQEVLQWQEKNLPLRKGKQNAGYRGDMNGILQGRAAGQKVLLNPGLGSSSGSGVRLLGS
jgi:hypothetical protein